MAAVGGLTAPVPSSSPGQKDSRCSGCLRFSKGSGVHLPSVLCGGSQCVKSIRDQEGAPNPVISDYPYKNKKWPRVILAFERPS